MRPDVGEVGAELRRLAEDAERRPAVLRLAEVLLPVAAGLRRAGAVAGWEWAPATVDRLGFERVGDLVSVDRAYLDGYLALRRGIIANPLEHLDIAERAGLADFVRGLGTGAGKEKAIRNMRSYLQRVGTELRALEKAACSAGDAAKRDALKKEVEELAATGSVYDPARTAINIASYGLFLGYPECCVRRYVIGVNEHMRLWGELGREAYMRLPASRFPEIMKGYGMPAVPWAACSPECKPSLEYSKGAVALLKKYGLMQGPEAGAEWLEEKRLRKMGLWDLP